MALAAGRLNKRVTVEERTPTKDEHGHEPESWSALYHRWAEIRGVSVSEQVAHGQSQSVASHTIRMRAMGIQVNGKHRIAYQGRVYEIVGAIDVDSSRDELMVPVRIVEP